MKKPQIPANEEERLGELHRYGILDTPPEPSFDALTTLAAHIAQVPIALVSLVDVDRQWFKSRYGLEAPQTPRDVSFCGHVVASEATLIVPDAFQDDRFADNPLVTGQPRVRFYAGIPLRNPSGYVLGTLCAIDHHARELTPTQQEMLSLLAKQVVDQLELRRKTIQLQGYGRFFDISISLLCTADATMYFRELNPAWEQTLGWTLDELKARPFTDLIHPDDVAPTLAVAGQLLEGATTVNFENRYRHKDGRWIPMNWHASARDGVFYAAALDLSELRRKEASLLDTEGRYRSIIEAAVDAVITIDERGSIDQVNPAVERLFGFAPHELLGQNVKLLMPAPYREEHDGYLANYLSTGNRKIIGTGREITGARKDGSTFPAELAVSEFYAAGARFFTGIVRDISDRKRVERMQSEFVSTVSHELRTPLTSIRGSLGLVSAGVTGELPAEAKEYVDIALSNSDRLVRLINDILDIEKMQSGSMEFRLRATDLGAAVRGAISANQAFASSHGVRLLLASEIPLGEVFVDTDRLAQVLANLISNAAKFSPRDGVVELAVERSEDLFRVTIRDHGPGIPEEFRGRIFQRFAQADASNTRRRGGTGLGLSISKAIVEQMRGRIGFKPAEGGGTVFFFELPYLHPIVPEAEPSGAALVLVCEDDPDEARVLGRLLTSAGFAVHYAPTLERVRRLLTAHRYSAILLDLILPDGDGTALIQEIRSSKATSWIPIIAISGSSKHLRQAALMLTDVIVKPFDETALLAAVRNAVAACMNAIPRILHVEDDEDIRLVVKRLLPDSWTVIPAPSIQAAKAELEGAAFDVVLLDLTLPDGAGDELIQLVGRAQVIIFSASDASSALSRRVSSALVKSRMNPVDVRDVIVSLVARGTTSDEVRP